MTHRPTFGRIRSAAAGGLIVATAAVLMHATDAPTDLQRQMAKCHADGLAACHVERDLDGTLAVYGRRPVSCTDPVRPCWDAATECDPHCPAVTPTTVIDIGTATTATLPTTN